MLQSSEPVEPGTRAPSLPLIPLAPPGQLLTKSYWLISSLTEIHLGSSLTHYPIFLLCQSSLANSLMRGLSCFHIWNDPFKNKTETHPLLPKILCVNITKLPTWYAELSAIWPCLTWRPRLPSPHPPHTYPIFQASWSVPTFLNKFGYLKPLHLSAKSSLWLVYPFPSRSSRKPFIFVVLVQRSGREMRCFSSCVLSLPLTHTAILALRMLSSHSLCMCLSFLQGWESFKTDTSWILFIIKSLLPSTAPGSYLRFESLNICWINGHRCRKVIKP